jgi:hypothetical protein
LTNAGIPNKENGHQPPKESGRAGHFPARWTGKKGSHMPKRQNWEPSIISVGDTSLFSKGEIEAYETDILTNSRASE